MIRFVSKYSLECRSNCTQRRIQFAIDRDPFIHSSLSFPPTMILNSIEGDKSSVSNRITPSTFFSVFTTMHAGYHTALSFAPVPHSLPSFEIRMSLRTRYNSSR